MVDYAALRQRMVENQLRPRDITDHRLIRAFLETPREMFVRSTDQPLAYADRDLPLAGGTRHLIAAPVLARLVQALELGSDDVALIVGCGTGFPAAILARLAGSVVAVEDDGTLVAATEKNLAQLGIDNVAVVQADLREGYPAEGPYDAILIPARIEVLPEVLTGQLGSGGRLATIMCGELASRAMLYERVGEGVSGRPVFDAGAPLLPGFERKAQFVF